MRNVIYLLVFTFYLISGFGEENHEFRGKHFLASYLACDPGSIENEEKLQEVMLEAVRRSGAQILDYKAHVFPGHGLTMVIMLSESHASIHTYPEYGACFVDLFTCGDRCSHIFFDEALRAYLKPVRVNEKLLIRDHDIHDALQK